METNTTNTTDNCKDSDRDVQDKDPTPTPEAVTEPKVTESAQEATYFASYDSLEVHEVMLKDAPRTLAYKSFIEENAALFRDKVVVDVGAGTGILSMFAARAGAKQVFAVEASQISQVCQHLVAHNDLAHKVKVIHGRVEDVTLPDGVKADIIISEWMGFYLLHESMLASVVTARDKWLAPDGIILPTSAALYLCPVSMKQHQKDSFLFWQDVYGFDFSPVLPAVKSKQLSEPLITCLEPSQCLAPPEMVTHLDLLYVGLEDLHNITVSFSFRCHKNDVLHGFAAWFDVQFEGALPVKLDTGPNAPPTHWKQTVVMLPYPLLVCKEEEVSCSLSLQQDCVNPRHYNISIEVVDEDSESDTGDVGAVGSDSVQGMLMEALDAQHQ